MRINYKYVIYWLVLIILPFSACKKNSATTSEENGIIVMDNVSEIKSYPGKNRIKLSWLLESHPEINKVTIYWNNKAKSLEVPVKKKAGVDTMEVMLTNMEEGAYVFNISTTANSVTRVIKGNVYGNNYISSLKGKTIKSITTVKGMASVDWETFSQAGAIGVEIIYADSLSFAHKIIEPVNKNNTVLDKVKTGYLLNYRTIYLPESAALDTFYTDNTSSKDAVKYSSFITKKIDEGSSLISNVLTDTLIELSSGIEQTNIHYKGRDGRLISMFVLTADLKNTDVKIKAGTPFNKPEFKSQIVSEIAKAADVPGNRVIAAVNADFFVSLAPQGIVVKNGVSLKTQESLAGTGFLGIYNDGNPVIGNFSKFTTDLPGIKEALGGYHMLINNYAKVSQGDPSVAPRTIVGYDNNNLVYFIVIDGRKPLYSEGMPFSQLSDLMYALQARYAINLDGGGSSTFVVKNKNTNTWEVKNQPSDGTQRAVYNAWTIVDVSGK